MSHSHKHDKNASMHVISYRLAKAQSSTEIFFLHYVTNGATAFTEPVSNNVFSIFLFISQMGVGTQGHTSWKTDGFKRHQGHCGHNESAYVCSYAVPSLPLFLFLILQITGVTICICWLMDIWGMLFSA